MSNTFDWAPPPYPPRRSILALLDLPPSVSEAEYLAKWEEVVTPMKGRKSLGIFERRVNEALDEGFTYEKAWELAKVRFPRLWEAVEAEEKIKREMRQRRRRNA